MSIEDKNSICKKYKDYSNSKKKDDWSFGNSILYRMCEEYPLHNCADVIIGKVWLIGRSYSAAIERRKTSDDYTNDEFYIERVAPKMLNIGKDLDDQLDKLRKSNKSISDEINEILSIHKFLTDVFLSITGQNKRSLASKYLHFHCPKKFFIFDSRVSTAINNIVKKTYKTILDSDEVYDKKYSNFVCGMLELQECLKENVKDINVNPRDLDNFLLSIAQQKGN